MREENGVLNPDQTAVDAVVARLAGKPKAALGETIKDSAKRIKTALAEMSGSFDWSKAESLGGSATDASSRITAMKAVLAERKGAETVLRQLNEAERLEAENDAAIEAIESGASGERDERNRLPGREVAKHGLSDPRSTAESVALDFVNKVHGQLSAELRVADKDTKATALKNRLKDGITLDVNPGDLFLPDVQNVISGANAGGANSMHIFPQQSQVIIDGGRNPFELVQVMPRIPVTSNTWEYRSEVDVPNVAGSAFGEVAENAELGGVDYDWSEQTANIRKLGGVVEVTMEQLADEAQLAPLLARLIRTDVMRRVDRQILLGPGTGNLISGLQTGIAAAAFGNPGSGETEYGADKVLDQITECYTLGYTSPSHLVFHATDWSKQQQSRDSQGRLLMGDTQGTVRPMLWGYPVIRSLNETAGTVFVGDFTGFSALLTRQGVMVEATDSHGTNFAKTVVAIRAYTRVGVARFRDAAFQAVSGFEGSKTG